MKWWQASPPSCYLRGENFCPHAFSSLLLPPLGERFPGDKDFKDLQSMLKPTFQPGRWLYTLSAGLHYGLTYFLHMQFIFWCTSFRNAQVCITARRRIHETRVNSLRLQWRCDEIVVTTHKHLENRSTLMNKRQLKVKRWLKYIHCIHVQCIRDRFLQRTQNQIQTTWPGTVGGSPAWWVRLTWKKCRMSWSHTPLHHVLEVLTIRMVYGILYTSFTL